MGTLGNPKIWPTFMNTKDCTKRFCSLACPQWCYMIFTPPPPTPFIFPNDKSQTGPSFSPLVIAIIGVLASAFLLVSYYAIISKYCGNPRSNDEHQQQQPQPQPPSNMNEDIEDEGHDQHQPWLISTPGLDEALIRAITPVKYHKGDGLIGSSDCSVCLGEFLEDDSLRLLPECSHAFHVTCIDTWLKSHSNCPLCRANIISSFAPSLPSPPPPPPPPPPISDHHHQQQQNHDGNINEEIRSRVEERAMGVLESSTGKLPKSPFRALSDLGELGLRKSGGIDVTDDHGMGSMIRRSLSMDHSCETRVSISGILRIDQRNEDDDQSLKFAGNDRNCSNSSSGVLQCVMNSVSTKRNFPSGRFLFSKNNAVIPL